MEREFEESTITMVIEKVEIGKKTKQGYFPLKLKTNRGTIVCRYYHETTNALAAAIFVGDAGGDFNSPAKNLYPKLSKDLSLKGINCLRIQYREPLDVVESVMDVLIGIAFLERNGIKTIGLVGHSFGGPVVIQAAASSSVVRTVVTLATQEDGVEPVTEFHALCSILLIHGLEDKILPPYASVETYELAHESKEIILYENTGHLLNEVADRVYSVVESWLAEELTPREQSELLIN